MLFEYMKRTQRLLREQRQSLIDTSSLISYINLARREVANRTSCVRITPPISGSIMSISITSGGSGYTAPVVTISPPDFPSGVLPSANGAQATVGAVTVVGGVITSIAVTFGGSGYFQPIVIITDATGSGAVATTVMSPMNLLLQAQERYDLANMPISSFPGVQSIIGQRSVSIIYSNYRYSIPQYSWTVYQGYIRQFPSQYEYVPTFYSQFGQGAAGTLFMYPLPSQTYQFEVDCTCQPIDLTTDQSVEAIPQPWQDCIHFLAAYYGYLELQNMNAAKFMRGEFESFMLGQSQSARIGRTVNIYGRYVVPFTLGALTLLQATGSLFS